MNVNGRVYKPIELSDLPKIQSGELKVFRKIADDLWAPARLVSAQYSVQKNCLFLYDWNGRDEPIAGIFEIYKDVTPEYRYAIWNHKAQRFAYTTGSYASNSFKTESEALAEIDRLQKHYGWSTETLNNFYVVKFEVKGQ